MPHNKLLDFPYGSYLMVRLDYLIICGDELEAKIMRLIEMYMEDERRSIYKQLLNNPQNNLKAEDVVEVTKDVWAPISHRLFMNDLYGMVKSENTLKRALRSLKAKGFIAIRDKGLKQYEAPKYQILAKNVQKEFDKLRNTGKAGYQRLIPSTADTIKNSPHQNLTPSGDQPLTPSGGSRVSTADTNSRKVTEVEGNDKKGTDGDSTNADRPPAPTDLPDWAAQRPTLTESETEHAQVDFEPSHQDSYSHPNGQATQGENHGQDMAMAHDRPDSRQHTHDDSAADRQLLPTQGMRRTAENQRQPHENAQRPQQPHGRDERADQRLAPEAARTGAGQQETTPPVATSERGAPSAAMPDSGYEKDGKSTGGRADAQQLSTGGKVGGQVSAHVEPKQGRKPKDEPEPITLSANAQKVWDAWGSLFHVEVKLGKANAKAAEDLVKPARIWCSVLKISLVAWLTLLKDYAFANDSRGYYQKRGVKLYDLPNELEGWQSAKEHELDQAKRTASQTSAGTFSGLPRWTPVYPQA